MEHMLYAKSISWFDDCRIPFIDGDTTSAGKRTCNIFETEYKSGGNGSPDYITDSRGRFPSNILVSDDMLNDGIVRKGFNGGGGPTRFAHATGGKNLMITITMETKVRAADTMILISGLRSY